MLDWKNKKIGIVLSGGGAKGTYQAGMFEALEELGLKENIEVISGCSAGAMNAAAYSCLGPKAVYEGTLRIGDTFKTSAVVPERTVRESRRMVDEGKVSLDEFFHEQRFAKFDTARFDKFMEETLSEEKMSALRHKIYICCYNVEKEKPEYFCLNSLDYRSQLDLIKASGSLPFLFPAVEYKGYHYLDGGVVPAICKNPEPKDKIPLLPLAGEKLDAVLVCFLNPEDTVDRNLVEDGISYLELRPSRPLEAIPGMGTLDFTPEVLEDHRKLGYSDTMKLFNK